ncbi:hypothetical protein ACSQ67_025653 [Phaseolus vulgaris]
MHSSWMSKKTSPTELTVFPALSPSLTVTDVNVCFRSCLFCSNFISCQLQQDVPKLGNAAPNDGEYARILAIMDELEKEELAAQSGDHSDENDDSTGDFDEMSYQGHIDNNLQNLKDFRQSALLDQTNNKITTAELPEKRYRKEDIADQLNFARLGVQSTVRESEKLLGSIYPSEKIPVGSRDETMTSKTEVEHETAKPSFDSRKAFTGSIIEHAENIERSSREQSSASSQGSGSQSSKPVSRFKMQRS